MLRCDVWFRIYEKWFTKEGNANIDNPIKTTGHPFKADYYASDNSGNVYLFDSVEQLHIFVMPGAGH